MDQLRFGPFVVPKIIEVKDQQVNLYILCSIFHIFSQFIQDLTAKLVQFKAFLHLSLAAG